jgi:hypothetical protein
VRPLPASVRRHRRAVRSGGRGPGNGDAEFGTSRPAVNRQRPPQTTMCGAPDHWHDLQIIAGEASPDGSLHTKENQPSKEARRPAGRSVRMR